MTIDAPVFCPVCSRRSLMTGAAAFGAASMLPRDARAAAAKDRLVDAHFHVGAPKLAELQGKRSGRPGNNPSRETLLGVLDEGGVATGVCSTIIPTDVTDDVAEIRGACRDANEWLAKLHAGDPTRFAMLGSLPLPDIDATLKEIAYCFDTLHMNGVHMPTSVAGHWFGDAWFTPVLEELNRRKAVIKTHPSLPDSVKIKDLAFVGTGIVELGADTMRAMAALL